MTMLKSLIGKRKVFKKGWNGPSICRMVKEFLSMRWDGFWIAALASILMTPVIMITELVRSILRIPNFLSPKQIWTNKRKTWLHA